MFGWYNMYAGLWRRFFASVIDNFLYSVVYFLWLIILFPQKGLNFFDSFRAMLYEGQFIWFMFQYILFPLTALWLYNTLFECSSMQGTLGKLLGIKVTDSRGTGGVPESFVKVSVQSRGFSIVDCGAFHAFVYKEKAGFA